MSAQPEPLWIARIAAGQPARLRKDGESVEDYRIAMGWDQPKAKPLLSLLGGVDDHLQALQHYAHSHELREAMSRVMDLQEVLAAMADYFGGAKDRFGRPDPVASDAMRAARDRILKLAQRYEVASAHTVIDQCARVMHAVLAKTGSTA